MNKKEVISRDNRELLGKYYLKKSVDHVVEGSFGKAYEFMKEGLDIATCDCGFWREKFINSNKDLFEDSIISLSERLDYYFVKAYLYSFEETKEELYVALNSINKYLRHRVDEYGLYVKGNIYLRLSEHQNALDAFSLAIHQFGKNPRILYRIGRLKEHYFNEYGLKYLFDSFDMNPSSTCCARVLKQYMQKRCIQLALSDKEDNELIISFTNSNEETRFEKLYASYWSNEILDEINLKKIYTLPIIHKYIEFLRYNKSKFVDQSLEDENNHDYQDYYEPEDRYIDTRDNPHYIRGLDMDQQGPEFWDEI